MLSVRKNAEDDGRNYSDLILFIVHVITASEKIYNFLRFNILNVFSPLVHSALDFSDDMAVSDVVWDTFHSFFSISVNQRLFKRKFIENLCCRSEWKMMKILVHLSFLLSRRSVVCSFIRSLDFNCVHEARNFMNLILI